MIARNEQSRDPNYLPAEWSLEVKSLLQEVYAKHIEANKEKFDVIGLTYPNEFLLVVSLQDENDRKIPVTYLASYDISDSDQEDSEKQKIDKLVDSVSIFFDSYFQNKEEMEYTSSWNPANYGGVDFFYKVTRENVRATLVADRLIKESQ